MAPKSDTWMAFYVGDYLANTLHLAREHHGSYLLLILAAFKNDGWLPNDDGLLAQIAKATPKQWRIERAMYARFFIETADRWTHKRVTAELEKSERLTEQRRAAGTASAAKRQREGNDRSTSVDVSLQRTGRPSEPQSDVTTNLQVERESASAPRTPKPEKTDGKFKLPAAWRPDADCRAYAQDRGLNADDTADVFVDHFTVRKGKSERRNGPEWAKRWQAWCRADTNRSGPVGTRPARAAQPPRGNEAFYDELAAISHRSRVAGEPVGREGQPDGAEPPAIPDEAWHAPR